MQARTVDGALTLTGSHASVRAALPRVTYRVGDHPVVLAPVALEGPPEGPWSAADTDVRLTLRSTASGDAAVVLWAGLEVIGRRSIRLDAVDLLATGGPGGLALGAGPAGWSLYRNGWGSWSNARAVRMDESDPDPWLFAVRDTAVDPATPRSRRPGELRSELVAAIADQTTGAAVVLGFLGGTRAFSVVDLTVAEARLVDLRATCTFDGIDVDPGAAVSTEELLVADGDDGYALLERWADALGGAQQARVPDRPPHGWCSWYYYYSGVDEGAVRENLAAADRIGDRVPLGYVMIDDGHQTAIGDWLATNEKFPSGMAALATDIRATGRDAGIWLAPFIVDPRSALARACPGWVLRDDRGRPVPALWNPTWSRRHRQWALDTTHPEVLGWLADMIGTVRHDWGYRVIKLDFLYAAALPGARTDRRATRATALRRGLEAIREAAGDDTVIIGCGLPLGPAVGIVDGMRIGTDVAPNWGGSFLRWATTDQGGLSTRLAVRNTLTRAVLHGRLWANDPDCVMVRTDRTRLTEAEVRSLVAAVALTDGMIVSSDRLDLVPPERLDLLSLAHDLAGGTCRVVDLFDRPTPELVVSTKPEEVLVGAFNSTDVTRRVVLDLPSLGVPAASGPLSEAFSGDRLRAADGRVDLGRLDPHDVRVLRVPLQES